MLGLGVGFYRLGGNNSLVGTFSNKHSILLNGTTQYIDVDTAAGNINPSKGTFSAWVKFDSDRSNAIIIKATVDSNNQISIAYINSSTKWRFTYKAGGTSKIAEVVTEEEVNKNWVHLAMTWDVEEDELKGYVNGTQQGGTISSLGTFSGTINECYLGMNTLSNNSFFGGHVDEVSMFNEVVSVASLYNGGLPKDVEFSSLNGLIAYWRFTEGAGVTSVDESANDNTATLINNPTWSTLTVRE